MIRTARESDFRMKGYEVLTVILADSGCRRNPCLDLTFFFLKLIDDVLFPELERLLRSFHLAFTLKPTSNCAVFHGERSNLSAIVLPSFIYVCCNRNSSELRP